MGLAKLFSYKDLCVTVYLLTIVLSYKDLCVTVYLLKIVLSELQIIFKSKG